MVEEFDAKQFIFEIQRLYESEGEEIDIKKMKLKLGTVLNDWIPALILLFLQWSLGALASGNVTLESIEIFKSHELIKKKPTVYFQCQGEKRIYLPDVKETNTMYTFKGEESWQPLTALMGRKCKRCGIYEEDMLFPDDRFDEWELCPDDFSLAPEGKYKHYKEKEVNATFLCLQCNSKSGTSDTAGQPGKSNSSVTKIKLWIVFILIATFIISATVVFIYKVWRKKKREEEQARFLKLFEDDDDLEIEMGLRDSM